MSRRGLLLLFLCCGLTASRPSPPLAPPLAPPCAVVQMEVSCSDRALHSAPSDLPRGIRSLDLSRNRLQNLSQETLSFHTDLHLLNLHGNKIHFIQPGLFAHMPRLQVLDLSRNHLSALAEHRTPLGPLGTVQSLDLSGNGLFTGMTDVFLHDSPQLVNLSLSGNSITKISGDAFRGAASLQKVDLHNNVVMEIEAGAFDSLFHLSDLDLSKNSINCITDFDLRSLRTLNLSQNSLEMFQSSPSDQVSELLSLDLSQNNLPLLPLLPRNNRLERLDVSRNQIQSVNVTGSYGGQMFFFCTCLAPPPSVTKHHTCFHHLRFLDMSYNNFQSLPECLFHTMLSLEVLNVSNNCIASFSISRDLLLPKVLVLDLSENSLQTFQISPGSLQSLQELYLSGNSLAVLDSRSFQSLANLRLLHLQRNDIQVCPHAGESSESSESGESGETSSSCTAFQSIPSLEFLDLSENNLLRLPPDAFQNTPLKHLDLSTNPGLVLHRDSFSGLENSLVHLFLKENNLTELNSDLSALTRLKYVDLSTNQLTTLPPWSRQSSIESLNLQNNNLVTLEQSTVLALERSLKTLYVGANPLRCCSNLAFLHLLQRSAVVVADIEAVTCLYLEDSPPVSIEKVTQEMCEDLHNGSVNVVMAVMAALVLAVALALIVKCCQARRRRRRMRSYRA
uniref:Leucine rich repeat containing 32 n=1 Tax=Neogobius melanostomus TaxID=47308 RepID=A0A8C6T9D1_9GOBI